MKKMKNNVTALFCVACFSSLLALIYNFNYIRHGDTQSLNNTQIEPEQLFIISKYIDGLTKFGYINQKGKIVLDTQFELIGNFSEGMGFVKNTEKTWELVDVQGQKRKIPKYWKLSSSDYFSEGLLEVEIFNKYGYMDKTGKIIIQPQFEYASIFSEGLASIRMNGKIGYIDKNGKIVIPPKFDQGYAFSEGLAAIKIGDKWGYINKVGTIVIKPQFDSIQSFSEGLAAVESEKNNIKKSGYINKTGKLIIDSAYFHALNFHDGLAPACDSSGCGYINKYGQKTIFLPKHTIVDEFSNGLALINIENKYSYINKQGKMAIPLKFDDATGFKHGLASVLIKNFPICKSGYIDKTGKFIWSQTNFML